MRLRLALALLLVCVSAPLLAQTPDESSGDTHVTQPTPQSKAPAPPPATARISGTVFCSDTHRPARGAMVMAQPMPKEGNQVNVNPTASISRVGLDGTYVLKHLHPGDYTVVALLPGYLSPFDDLKLDQMTGPDEKEMRERLSRNGIVSARNNETAHMDVTLTRGATITGRVLFDDGAPATQVLLNLEDVNAKPAVSPKPGRDLPDIDAGTLIRSMFLHQTQGTDDQGNFRISGIKPGTYRISAVQPPESLADGEGDGFGILFGVFGDSKSLHFYSGDTLHKKKAKTYELGSGDDVSGIEITIPVYAFHRIEGHLTTLDGRPIFSGTLTLTDASDDGLVLRAAPARDGSFVFPTVPDGTYKLAVTGAQLGNVPDGYPANLPVGSAALRDAQLFADTSTTVLVKDADVTDLSIQLQNATPTSNQPATTPPASAAPSDPD